jgi:hypothetical protein
LLAVFYGCETWSLTLREEHRLKVFGKKVLRMLCGPKRNETIEGCRKPHNEELHNVFCSTNIIRMIKSITIRWAGDVASMGTKRNAYRHFMGKSDGKRPLANPNGRIIRDQF